MSRHFGLSSELSGALAKRLPHANNQLSVPGSFFNQFVADIYIYTSIYTYIYLYHMFTHINRVLIVKLCILIYNRLRLIGSLFNRVNRLIGPLLAGPE